MSVGLSIKMGSCAWFDGLNQTFPVGMRPLLLFAFCTAAVLATDPCNITAGGAPSEIGTVSQSTPDMNDDVSDKIMEHMAIALSRRMSDLLCRIFH